MVYVYIAVMAFVTYLIRVIPLTVFRKKIENRYIQSFLYYVPYTCLTAMTFPAILYATESIWRGRGGGAGILQQKSADCGGIRMCGGISDRTAFAGALEVW